MALNECRTSSGSFPSGGMNGVLLNSLVPGTFERCVKAEIQAFRLQTVKANVISECFIGAIYTYIHNKE